MVPNKIVTTAMNSGSTCTGMLHLICRTDITGCDCGDGVKGCADVWATNTLGDKTFGRQTIGRKTIGRRDRLIFVSFSLYSLIGVINNNY